MLYQSLLEHKNFVKLKEIIVLLSYQVSKAFFCTKGLYVLNEKLREVSVSSFFRTDNYAVVMGISMDKYHTKAS